MKEIVSIDLGSNSFRVLKYDYENHQIISEYNKVVGTADGLVDTGIISEAAINRIISAINESIKIVKFDPSKAVCITTAAMRKAKNSKDVLSILNEKCQTRFKIIDGNEEARLTLLAIKYALIREKIDSKNFILLDIGGGSTELIINTDQKHISKSFDFGIVTMTQDVLKSKNLDAKLEFRKNEISKFLNDNKINPDKYTFIATAGTPTTVAAIKLGFDIYTYDRNKINGSKVYFDDLDYCIDIMKNSTKDELIELVGKGRVEYIETGIMIYKTIFEVLNKKESIVFDDGLREGIAINEGLKVKKL